MDIASQIPLVDMEKVGEMFAYSCLYEPKLYDRFSNWSKDGAVRLMEAMMRLDMENASGGNRTFHDVMAVRNSQFTLAYADGRYDGAIEALQKLAADCLRAVGLLRREKASVEAVTVGNCDSAEPPAEIRDTDAVDNTQVNK